MLSERVQESLGGVRSWPEFFFSKTESASDSYAMV
jgi:hypothetical protein